MFTKKYTSDAHSNAGACACNLSLLVGLYYTSDPPSANDVAVKILKEGMSNEVKEDFEREVEIMSNFHHDNILSLLGIITKGIIFNYGKTPPKSYGQTQVKRH